jgi:hypothetical protein
MTQHMNEPTSAPEPITDHYGSHPDDTPCYGTGGCDWPRHCDY